MNDTAALPRITYTSVPADIEPVHAWFDANLPRFRAALGQAWPNRIRGTDDRDGAEYPAVSPLDSEIVLGRYIDASPAAVTRAVAAARNASATWGRTDWRTRVATLRALAEALDGIEELRRRLSRSGADAAEEARRVKDALAQARRELKAR